MVLVEDRGRPLQVERLFGPLVPRQLSHGLEIRADDLGFHRVPGRALEPRQLAVHFLLGGFGKLERRKALAQLLDVTRLVPLAQLLADRLHLLAQEQLPLALAQLLLNLRLDVLLGVEHADLALDVHQHPAQPLLDLEGFEQGLALGRVDLQVAGHEVGEASGFRNALEHLPDDLLR